MMNTPGVTEYMLRLTTFLICCHYATGFSEAEVEEISQTIEDTRKCQQIPGLSVALVHDGEPVQMRNGYGWADVENNIQVDADTAFCVGSITKSFTASLIARHMDERRINITFDTPIREVLGDTFHMSDPVRTSLVTLRDLLAHKTGIPDYTLNLFTGYSEGTTLEQLVEKIRYMCPTKPFRVKFEYNNYMYALAAYVLQVLTGASWEQMVQEYILDELEMTHTGFVDVGDIPAQLALPYISRGGRFHPVDPRVAQSLTPAGPAGSICSSANDMTKWLLYNLNATEKRWQHSNHSELYKRQISLPDFPTNLYHPASDISVVRLAYGLGWIEMIYRGYQVFYHAGGISTYLSAMFVIPSLKSALFISVSGINQWGHLNPHLEYYLLDKLIGIPSEPNEEKLCEVQEPDGKDELRVWRKTNTTAIESVLQRSPSSVSRDDSSNATSRVEGVNSSEVSSSGGEANDSIVKSSETDLERYTGEYKHPAFDLIRIYRNRTDKSLHLRLGRLGHALLSPTTNPREFTGQWKDRLLGLSTYLKLNRRKSPDFTVEFDNITSNHQSTEPGSVKIKIETIIDSIFKRQLASNIENFSCGPEDISAAASFSSMIDFISVASFVTFHYAFNALFHH